MHIGIDVGGTNTDAVLMDGDVLAGKIKSPTTPDVTSGIISCINTLNASKPNNAKIDAVMLGTTHFVNALLQRAGLAHSAALRLCLPATTMLPPLVDWPDDLRSSIGGHTYMANGGHEYDGREISSIDEIELRTIAKKMNDEGVRSVSISGVFSPVDDSHEKIAADIITSEIPSMKIIDLAKWMAPNYEIRIIGIRPGEKLNEALCTKDDSHLALEFKDYYVILPTSSQIKWKRKDFLIKSSKTKGKMCNKNFSYNSKNNKHYLSIKEIKKLISNNLDSFHIF